MYVLTRSGKGFMLNIHEVLGLENQLYIWKFKENILTTIFTFKYTKINWTIKYMNYHYFAFK